MGLNSAGFMCLKNKFLRISVAKIKEGAFVGPQTRELINDIKSEEQLSEVEKSARNLMKKYHYNFWGEIIRQNSIVICWLIMYSRTKLRVQRVFKGAFLRISFSLILGKCRESGR